MNDPTIHTYYVVDLTNESTILEFVTDTPIRRWFDFGLNYAVFTPAEYKEWADS